jgi:apolipoprotein N-acyltransferase
MDTIKIEPSDILPPPEPPKKPDTNREAFAIIGFIFSLLSLCGLYSPNCAIMAIFAIVFSALALKTTKRRYALAGLIIGISVIVIDIVLMIIYIFIFNKSPNLNFQ